MKKFLSLILTAALAGVTLTACSSNGTSSTASSNDASSADTSSAASSAAESSAESTADTDNVIKIGATATPHGEILEFVKDKLAKEGYDLQITITMIMYCPTTQLQAESLTQTTTSTHPTSITTMRRTEQT